MHNSQLPKALFLNPRFRDKIFEIYKIPFTNVGNLYKVDGYTEHNYLVDINSIFSSYPNFGIFDRTLTVQAPVLHHIPRPWHSPETSLSLGDAMQQRVLNITATSQKINLMWSGGIDSTAILTAFLKHAPDLTQLRVLYSPWSTYEHPEYLGFLDRFPDVERVDVSGDVYLNTEFDGIFVTGDSGDESHASLDQSFIEKHGYHTLFTSWKDFFKNQNNDQRFIEFCERHFLLANRPIETVLEARWWFYISSKLYGLFYGAKMPFFVCGYENFVPSRLIPFFDCPEYEQFIFYNVDLLIQNNDYASWRQFLKDYCFEFDQLATWRSTHRKITSRQLLDYSLKQMLIKDKRWLMILEDGTRVSTPNLPLLSEFEFRKHWGSELDYLFNQ